MSSNQPTLLNCPACGAPLDYDGTSSVIRCKFCGNRSLVQGGSSNQEAGANAAFEEIRQMAVSGNLQNALDQVRALVGVNDEDANDTLNAIKEGRYAKRFVSKSHTQAELTETLQRIQGMLAAGNKEEAVSIYRETFDTSMKRALKAIELIERGQGFQPEIHYDTYSNEDLTPPPLTYSSPTTRKKGCRAIPVLVIVVILAVVGVVLAIKGGLFLPHYYAQEPMILIPSGQDASPQIAGLFYDSGKEARFVGVLNTDTKRLVWQADPLKGDGIIRELVNGSDLIYAAQEDNLLAYSKVDGSLTWQTVMPDALNYSGHDLMVTSGRVITYNADRSIQAYNAETGSLVWSRKLTGYSDTALLVQKSLLVVDFADSNNNFGLYFLDPVTGEQQDLLTPTCTINDYTNALDDDTGIFYDPTSNSVFLVFTEGCIQDLDLASRQVKWTSINPDGFNYLYQGYTYLFTDSKLYFGNGGDLVAVAKSDGEINILSTNADHNIFPLEMSANTLIIRADRTRGTSRSELWGIDVKSGAQIWQITMQDAEPIDPPDEMSGLIDNTDFGWTLSQTSAGLVRITFKGEPNQLDLEMINPADGSAQNSQTIALKSVSGDFYDIPVVLGWQGNTVFLEIDSCFYALDVSTGNLTKLY